MEIKNTDALIIIDPQNDFVPGGALAVNDGDKIMANIAMFARVAKAGGATIVVTQDWHPKGHKSFASTWYKDPYTEIDMPYGKQTLWPNHCVQGTKGAEFRDEIKAIDDIIDAVIRKGTNPEVDSYSAFFENDKTTSTGLAGFLKDKGITRVILVGLAYDFCVGYSAVDARKAGFEAVVLKEMTRAIALPIPWASTGGYDMTTVDVIEDQFEETGVTVNETIAA